MNKTFVHALLGICLLVLSGAHAPAQQGPKLYKVGLLNPNTQAIAKNYVQAFRQELAALGYGEHNLVLEVRYAEGNRERMKDFANEFNRLGVDVLVTPSEPALLAARAVTTSIPIVTVSCDPLEKLVGSLNRPGGNVTGFSCVSAAAAGKRLGLLKSMSPSASRVALLYSGADAYEPDLRNVEESARKLDMTVTRFPVATAAGLAPAFDSIKIDGIQLVYIQLSAFFNLHRRAIADLALRHQLPSIFGFREYPEDGGLMAYGASNSDGYRRAAHFVDRILKGARPGDLPAEEPMRYELVINERTAKALGLPIPYELRLQADEILR